MICVSICSWDTSIGQSCRYIYQIKGKKWLMIKVWIYSKTNLFNMLHISCQSLLVLGCGQSVNLHQERSYDNMIHIQWSKCKSPVRCYLASFNMVKCDVINWCPFYYLVYLGTPMFSTSIKFSLVNMYYIFFSYVQIFLIMYTLNHWQSQWSSDINIRS